MNEIEKLDPDMLFHVLQQLNYNSLKAFCKTNRTFSTFSTISNTETLPTNFSTQTRFQKLILERRKEKLLFVRTTINKLRANLIVDCSFLGGYRLNREYTIIIKASFGDAKHVFDVVEHCGGVPNPHDSILKTVFPKRVKTETHTGFRLLPGYSLWVKFLTRKELKLFLRILINKPIFDPVKGVTSKYRYLPIDVSPHRQIEDL